jgi:N-acetylmuramoyl-L-alanine amidase
MVSFIPDSSVVSDVRPSPNFNERKAGRQPDMIVLHYTGMSDTESALTRLTSAGTDVSAHYVVLEDGSIVQCVPELARAWHAGQSSWSGETDINSAAIGIEIVNRGHDLGYQDFPLRQVAAVIALCKGIMLRRKVPKHRVLAHSDVAPGRKKDPGEKFPWRLLADSGVGHWAEPAPQDARRERRAGDVVATRLGELRLWRPAVGTI